MNTYGFTSVSAGVEGSLKEIDPLDANGSGIPLSTGDRAIGSSNGNLIFYSLESEFGHTDDGEIEIIPESNPGDFYWKRQGYTKDTFNGALSGEVFTSTSGSHYPPVGFSGSQVSYAVQNYTQWDEPIGSPPAEFNWRGFGMYGGFIHAVSDDVHIKINMTTGATDINTLSGTYGYYYMPGHCLNADDDSVLYITDIQDGTALVRFNMGSESEEPIPFVMPPGVSWTDIFGDESPNGSVGMRIGKWHYILGKHSSVNQGAARVNCLTGQVEQLSDSPGIKSGMIVPDFATGGFYQANKESGSNLVRWNTDDTWDTLAQTEYTGVGQELSWLDVKGNKIIIALSTNETAIYDILLDSWTILPYPSSSGVWKGSYPYWYNDIGAIFPWGYGPIDLVKHHAIIPANNPIRFVKN